MKQLWRVPADKVREIRRANREGLKRVGKARLISEAAQRSGWDSYHTVLVIISGPPDSRRITTVDAGAIEAARAGDVSRLVVSLRGRKPLANDDRKRLAAYIATRVRRRCWPPELTRALSRDPTEEDFDLLADLVERIGRKPGGVFDEMAHRAARLAEAIQSLWGRRIPASMRAAIINCACEIEGNESGTEVAPERVRNILDHPKRRLRRTSK